MLFYIDVLIGLVRIQYRCPRRSRPRVFQLEDRRWMDLVKNVRLRGFSGILTLDLDNTQSKKQFDGGEDPLPNRWMYFRNPLSRADG